MFTLDKLCLLYTNNSYILMKGSEKMKIESDSRQVPSIEKYTADKKYCDLLYGVLQEMSYSENIGGIIARYVNKGDITFQKLGDRIGLKRVTTATKFKNLISLGLIEEIEEERRYKLNYLDKSVASLIPYVTLRKLNNSLNHNAISLFVYLLKRYIANGEKEYVVTMAQMKNFIGIAATTTSNNEVIMDILEVLKLLGLVEYEYRQVEKDKTNLFITKMSNIVRES